ncbi:MFS transporter [Jeotgalibacillus salarius]|uniref:MFS transporter n=1 Tax=Jeotgalibacillus salarius TaxID=546023 RepID=A0A4Y8LJK7_9BACL|nr:MFS transporter [Jeotgalibacillus salarius]TFE02395.1 MFS transporter [Jeotgalibacillus salarius]
MHSIERKSVIVSAFFLNTAGFAVFSFLAVYLNIYLNLKGWETVVILSTLTISSRGLPFFLGLAGDRLGFKNLMISGLLLRSLGFYGLAVSSEFGWLVLFSVLIGAGAACYEPSALAYFASQPDPVLKRKTFLYLNISLNAGAVAGPLLGGLLLTIDPVIPFYLSSLTFLALSILQFFLLSSSESKKSRFSCSESLADIIHNKQYLYFCLTMIFYWFLFAQLTVAFPLYMYALTESNQWVSFVITMNALTGITLMILLKGVFQTVHPFTLIRIGKLLTACSFLMVAAYPGSYWLLVCVGIFTIGETMILPSSDYAVSLYSSTQNDAAYYGFSDFSFAIGATLGNFAAISLLTGESSQLYPWIFFTLIGVSGFLLSLKLSEKSKV